MRKTAMPLLLAVVLAGMSRTVTAAPDGSLDSLIAMLASDPSPRVRAQAALALKPHAGTVTQILVDALHDPSPVVRAAAARALTDGAPESAYRAIVQAVDDDDPLVQRWARTAACRLLGRAERVRFDVRQMIAVVSAPSDWAGKVFQEEVLTHLLSASRFDVTKEIDFSDEAPMEAPAEIVVRDWKKGPEFPQEAPPVQAVDPIAVALRGTAGVIDRNADGVRVRVRLALESMSGTTLWSGDATAWGKRLEAGTGDPDEEPGDLVALRTAARTVARLLLGTLAPRARAMGREDGTGGGPM